MEEYYKLVSEHTIFYHFACMQDVFNMANIPNGTTFRANQFKPTEITIQSSQPVLHFCDNAFDLMLWATKFGEFVTTKHNHFYVIKPISEVIKQRSNDSTKLYQCGANKIQFGKQIGKKRMFELAIKEYEKNPTEKQQMYKRLDLNKIVQDWKQHIYPPYLYIR